jgi:hypothetical protein
MAPARNEEGRDCPPSRVPLHDSEYSVWNSVKRINSTFFFALRGTCFCSSNHMFELRN